MRGKRNETHSVHYQGKMLLLSYFEQGKGHSKHADKSAKSTGERIYSDKTLNTYLRAWDYFCSSMQAAHFQVDGHAPRNLSEAVQYVPEYIELLKSRPGSRAGTTLSAWTVRTYFAGIGKVLNLSATDYDLPLRRRDDIRRSRGDAARDSSFSETANKDLIEFCCCTGLRSAKELQKITGSDLITRADGKRAIRVKQGKAGKYREAAIIGTEDEVQRVIERMRAAGNALVWPHVPSHADIHGYRRIYAQRLYLSIARDPHTLPAAERYCCRGSRSGTWFDKAAMLQVSRELGHERLNVVAIHYLI